jgi:hypothetical protein
MNTIFYGLDVLKESTYTIVLTTYFLISNHTIDS